MRTFYTCLAVTFAAAILTFGAVFAFGGEDEGAMAPKGDDAMMAKGDDAMAAKGDVMEPKGDVMTK